MTPSRSKSSRSVRFAVAGALSTALLTGGAAGAFAAPAPSPTVRPSITVKAAPTTVNAGQQVVFAGRVTGLAVGSTVQLQHKKGSKWTSLGAPAKVVRGGYYKLTQKFTTKGKEQLRVRGGNTNSPTVTVTVH